MNTKQKYKRLTYGFRKHLILFSYSVVFLVLITATVSFILIMKKYITEATIEKYEYVNEKMGLELKNCYQESDDLTSEFIPNTYIQKSLENQVLSKADLIALKKTLSYLSFTDMSHLFYMDNKPIAYTRVPFGFNCYDFLKSDLYKGLGAEYSKTKWIWQEDTLYHTGEKALFIGRYVRHMEYYHNPGVIMLKMSDSYFKNMLSGIEKEADVSYLVLNSTYDICYIECNRKEGKIPATFIKCDELAKIKYNRRISDTYVITKNGIMFLENDEASGFIVATYVPNSVLNAPLYQMYPVILLIAFVLCVVAILYSNYYSKTITKPLKRINSVMSEFDGTDFTRVLELHTNTELDSIGMTYNQMIMKIETLLEEIRQQEQDLRYSELNSLLYQLNPHFLYNTLDNIYMLARINKDERIMNMIQSLSKLLRISLSKGKDEITLREELEHVCSYLDLQMIRNNHLFQYQIECEDSIKNNKILKLVLQPIVENCIKHGFAEIYEGGFVQIRVTLGTSTVLKDDDKYLCIRIFNNGGVMDEDVYERINRMRYDDLKNLDAYFPQMQGGYGIANVISRLRLKYNEKISFYFIISKEDRVGTTCVIEIPASED